MNFPHGVEIQMIKELHEGINELAGGRKKKKQVKSKRVSPLQNLIEGLKTFLNKLRFIGTNKKSSDVTQQ